MAASWLFNQKGIDATSLDEIAATVGVTKKVIYHNIGGKDVLVSECYNRAFRFFTFVEESTIDFNGNRLDALGMSLTTLAAASLRRDIAPLVPMAGHGNWSEDVSDKIHDLVGELRNKGLRAYNDGMEEGSVRSLNAKSLLILRPGFYEWMPRWGGALTEAELEQAPVELTKLHSLGLAPLESDS